MLHKRETQLSVHYADERVFLEYFSHIYARERVF